jgi:malonyl-CoA O-methyltransferase
MSSLSSAISIEPRFPVVTDFPPFGTIAGLYDTALSLFGFARGIDRYLSRLEVGPLAPRRILDAGCGTGPLSFSLLRRFPEAEVVAFDLDPQMLSRMAWSAARRRISPARLTLARGNLDRPDRLRHFPSRHPLHLQADSFDVIALGAALEYADLDRALKGLHRLLVPGGLVLNLGLRPSRALAALGRITTRFTPYDTARLGEAFAAAGFCDIRSEPLGPASFPANLTRLATMARKG